MPWSNQNGGGGGPWGGGGGGNNQGPWGQGPNRPRGGNNGGPPDLEDIIRRGQDRLKNIVPGGFNGGVFVILALVLVVFWLIQAVYTVQPDERGVELRFGKPKEEISMPGLHFHIWPLETVEIVKVTEQQQNIGANASTSSSSGLMLTGDQNIVDLAYLVQWKVRSPSDFVFQVKSPRDTVRDTAETAMRAVVANASLNDTITSGRAKIEAEVIQLMQQILDEYGSGIIIQSVSIQKAAAPQAVDEEFKQVTAAQQQAQAAKNNANAYAQQVLAAAQGEAAEFDKIYEQYKLAPEVTRRRLYYETMEQVLSKTNKTIVEAPGVTPYLPLPGLTRRAEPVPDKPAQGAAR